MKRAAVIFHRFGPYHWARVRAAAERCNILAIEEAQESADYAWDEVEQPTAANLQKMSLLEKNERPRKPAVEIAHRLYSLLEREAPDTIFIPGWSDPAALTALDWALTSNVPVVIMSESPRPDEDRRALKEFLKRRLVQLCSAALVGGSPHAEYMEELGMSGNRIFTGYDAVDNDYFVAGAQRARENASRLRAELSLPERYFIASARFVERKNLVRLLRAYARYRRLSSTQDYRTTPLQDNESVSGSEVSGPWSMVRGSPWNLVLLGDGPLKSDLCHGTSDLGLGNSVLLPGFKQYDELPSYYGLASAFVHTSLSEAWGLVVNEALASGLPVIVSKQCGCGRDLVHNGENGFQFDATDEHALAQLMLRVASMSPTDLAAMGEKGRKVVAKWSPQNFARQFELAGKAAHKNRSKRAGVMTSFLLRALIRYSNVEAARLLPSAPAAATV